MFWWGDRMGGWSYPLMMIGSLVVWVLVIAAVVVAVVVGVRALRAGPSTPAHPPRSSYWRNGSPAGRSMTRSTSGGSRG